MDRIVGYVPAVFMLDYCFEAPCARILLFVDFKNKELICFAQAGLGRPNFPGANGSLFFIQYPQTLFTVRMLIFISIAMIRELMLLFLARIM